MNIPSQSIPAINLAADQAQSEILKRIGNMTRILHNNLAALGFDKVLEQVATEIPEARDRLNYIARMTEQAAERVLSATEVATPIQDHVIKEAVALENFWKLSPSAPDTPVALEIARDKTLQFVGMANSSAAQTKELLMEIMMAQDFQDLTGQVIKGLTTLTKDLEQQLTQLLIDFVPKNQNTMLSESLVHGPQINPADKKNVVASQSQVDDLLNSLGF
jgi:chemotaxis protein CheZ